MRPSFEPGMFIEKRINTKPDMAASRFHANSPQVLSSPSLIIFLQTTCADLMAPFLDKGEMVVSIRIELSHLASTPIGSEVTVRAEIVKTQGGGTIYFKVDAYDETEKIASGHIDMYIVNEERFARGVERKIQSGTKKAQSV
jgi:fluoroacetyl-CoA thioesterase